MKEIERKFLIINGDYKSGNQPVHIRQGYMLHDESGLARVRIEGDKASLTIKKNISVRSRWEFEYTIPIADAEMMLKKLCDTQIIEKYRYRIKYHGMYWDVDEFLGQNAGLLIAEIELETEEQLFDKPSWVGEEVSHDHRYLNARLAVNPYISW